MLSAAAALPDDTLVERLALVAADSGDTGTALNVLEGHRFQLVHQRYVRTELWRRVSGAPGPSESPSSAPPSLGEDCLAQWGAYREHDA